MMNMKSSRSTLNAKASSNRVALLLAGGDGMRLRELTREIAGTPIPKQYCRLWDNSSLFEATLARARLFAPLDRISVVINEAHIDLAMEQVHLLPKSNVLVQPQNRDTGPGMVFALLRMEAAHPDAIVAAFPSDHFIDNDEAFITQTLDAVDAINSMPDKIAILGISPDRPETGYGYILPDRIVKSTGRASPVKAFVEKPSLPDAHRIISRGGLWNTFVMIFRLRRMLDLIGMLVPDEFDKISELRESPHRAAELYRTLNSWNLSTRVLARIPQHLIMLKVTDVHWNDWGTRESIEHTYRRLDRVPFWSMSRQPANPATRSRNMIRARADSKEAADGLSVA